MATELGKKPSGPATAIITSCLWYAGACHHTNGPTTGSNIGPALVTVNLTTSMEKQAVLGCKLNIINGVKDWMLMNALGWLNAVGL